MSFWIYKKEDGKTSIITATIPIEMIMVIIGLLTAIFFFKPLVPAYAGFVLLLISKISLFKKGIWNSWGSKSMSRPFKYIYWWGYILMALSVLISIPHLLSNQLG